MPCVGLSENSLCEHADKPTNAIKSIKMFFMAFKFLVAPFFFFLKIFYIELFCELQIGFYLKMFILQTFSKYYVKLFIQTKIIDKFN